MCDHDDERQVRTSGVDPQAYMGRSHPAGQQGNRGATIKTKNTITADNRKEFARNKEIAKGPIPSSTLPVRTTPGSVR